MNNKSKTFITIITTIVLLGLAVLVWVRQDGKAMIFGSTTSQLVTKTIQSEEDWRRGEFENLEYDSKVGLKIKGATIQTQFFHLQLQNAKFENLKNLDVKYLVIDINDADLSKVQIEELKNNGKIVLSYLSIGEAEDYRDYWQEEWNTNSPSWLDEENPEWPGNYKVRYWEDGWQDIIFGQVKKIAQAGYSGAYLDIIDAYEYYQEKGRDTAAEEMVSFVGKIRNEARSVAGNFLIVPQNAAELYLDYPIIYPLTLDGMGKEDTWYDENGAITQVDQTKNLQALDKAVSDGKFILVIDYPTTNNNICAFYEQCESRGFYCTVSNRALDQNEPILCQE